MHDVATCVLAILWLFYSPYYCPLQIVENNKYQSWIVRIMCCQLGSHSFIKNVKEMEIKDIKDWCVQLKEEFKNEFI